MQKTAGTAAVCPGTVPRSGTQRSINVTLGGCR